MLYFRRRWLTLQIPLLFPVVVFAGQSLVLHGGASVSVSDPVMPANQSWRIEFQLHDFTVPPANVYNAALFNLLGTGAIARIYPDGTIETETFDKVVKRQPCFLGTARRTNTLVRMQKNVSAMLFSCEIWNYDGTGYQSQVYDISSLDAKPSGGGTIGTGASAALGFLRVATTLLPLGGRPPTTADGGDWTELKFDGNLKDSSGRNHNATGSASYMVTPNQGAFAYPRTAGAPAWSSWTSLRAGYPSQLDGSASYSLSDSSSAVTCLWQELDGPSTVVWSNQNTTVPTLDGLIFGMYSFSLQVTDVAGNTATANLGAGAVATDDNGVVVNADPNVDIIFGPMIAFGANPWGFADERALTATKLRIAAYAAQGLNSPSWATPGSGTVTYLFNGVGAYYGASPAAKLSKSVTDANVMSIAVADASPLNLSSLPTRILLGNGPREEVRICDASATRGPATLTVCYDGRGQISPADGYRAGAQSWAAGITVGQMKMVGSGTSFLSDICPAGPGPNGLPLYSAGSVQLVVGSTAVAGIGTVWNVANRVYPGYMLRVAAMHGGVPFVFSAYIASVENPTHLTLARPFPRDADAGSFTYSVIQSDFRQIAVHYNRPADGTDVQTFFQTSGCESDTDVFVYSGHDLAGLNGTLQSAKPYSFLDGFGLVSIFGPNFYGEDLAHRALYYRSGWTPALQAARTLGDHYVSSPVLSGGDAGGIPLVMGGGVIGGFAAAILDTSDPDRPSWSDLRGFARNGSIGKAGCNSYDSRDSGYVGTWLTLAALFDPDPVKQSEWNANLAQLLIRDQNCKGPDNSWANGFLWNSGSVPLTMTNGSAVVTGINIPQAMCYGIASGTMSVTSGSATGLGSGFVPGKKIVITGTRNGGPYTGFFQHNIEKDGSISMSALWPGDSGTASWVIENNDYLTTIAISNNDPQMTRNWACTWNSPSQITLDRAWDGQTEKDAHLLSYQLAGYGQQPFMLGIKILQMKLASQLPDGALSSAYAVLAAQAASWIHDVGYDQVTQGMHYARGMQACEPDTVPPPGSAFTARTPGCNNGLEPNGIRAARTLTAEVSQALRVYYESNPTEAAKAWGDVAYGSIWGNPILTTGGVYTDPNYVRDENSNGSLGAYKWTGFFFGMGMAHQWPAVRLGGVMAPRIRRVNLEVKPQALAAKARISVTAPSGKVRVFSCGLAAQCEVEVDDRQGGHLYRVQYLAADGKMISQSAPAIIDRLPRSLVKNGISRR
jgi:hypothetical protein